MPDPAAVEEAAERLARARRPLIFVGGGAVGTGQAVIGIAELIGAPALATNAGKGIVPDSHPLSLGGSILQAASQQELAQADVVLLIGSEVGSGDHFLPKLEINGALIRIDIDPGELTSMYAAAVPIQSDARAAVQALSAALARRQPASRRAEGERRVADILARNAALVTPLEKQHARVWQILRPVLPADTIVMGDATQLVYTGSFAMPMEQERCWNYSGTYCALGNALPMAIGARIGAPQRPVIAVAGDGGFMFTVNELATAAEERLALPVIVWNNDALNAIVEQMDRQGIPRIGVEPKSPDFLGLARSLGCDAVRPDSAAALARSVQEAFKAPRPTLIEVRQDSAWLLS
jgi:thiamine pyrophosphate-dependent acetolactate synthase large subunit-like protein